MINTDRNDPCPCGSGKKYKKCCLVSAEDTNFQYRRFQQTHARLIPQLTEFAFETFPPELIEEAWKDFNDHEEVESFDPASPMNVLFMPWFLFNWVLELRPPGGREFLETTVAEQFLVHNLERLADDEKTLLISSSHCPYTLCEIVEVKPGVGMTLFDLLRRIKYEVIERAASQTLQRGEIIYCATSDAGALRSNVGTGPYALRPTAKRDVLELRKWIISQIGSDSIATSHLHEFEYDIRGLYLHIVKGMFLPPQLANTDGNPMVPHKLYFDLESADLAFHALKTLAQGRSEAEFMRGVELKDDLVVKAEIEWLGEAEAKERFGGPVLLGLLKIDKTRLVVEVNSKQRAARIRKLIDNWLGNSATYKTTLIEPVESQVQEMWRRGSDPSDSELGSEHIGQSRSISEAEDPELRAIMEEVSRQHWNSWFDLPIPALNDMTPRDAARTEEGRDLLESLLLFYENSQSKSADNVLRADIRALRQELDLD